MNELALFAGAGGGILGGHILGWRTVCAVEYDPYARGVLLNRQRDGFLPQFPIWDDVRTFDGKPWRGSVDIVSGGFPCQDISAAGKGAGIEGERSGLWKHMARIVGEVQPRFVWVENSPMLVSRGLAVVLADLASLGYDARWGVVGAHHASAPHRRDRIWILANAMSARQRWIAREIKNEANAGNSDGDGCKSNNRRKPFQDIYGNGSPHESRRKIQQPRAFGSSELADTLRFGQPGSGINGFTSGAASDGDRQASKPVNGRAKQGEWWSTEPNVGGVADGMAVGVDPHGANAVGDVGRVGVGIPNRGPRLKAIGNGQCPAAMALAWQILSGGMES